MRILQIIILFMSGLAIDPALSSTMFSRAGSIRHSRLYSDRHSTSSRRRSEPKNKSEQPQSRIIRATSPSHYSPFNTISRDSRDSYLLRVTNEPNVKTIYRPNFDFGKTSGPGYSFYRQKIVRKINDVSIDPELLQPPIDVIKKQCSVRIKRGSDIQKPLISKDCLNWRKNHHDMDFAKQTSFKQGKTMTSTGFNTAQQSPKNSENKNNAHKFSSYSSHKYLQNKTGHKKNQLFDASNVNWGIVKKNWNTKGVTPFDTYADKIAVRQDRSQPAWNPKLDYDPDLSKIRPKVFQNLSFDQYTDRAENSERSKYPMRLSQRKDYGMSKYDELKQIISANKK